MTEGGTDPVTTQSLLNWITFYFYIFSNHTQVNSYIELREIRDILGDTFLELHIDKIFSQLDGVSLNLVEGGFLDLRIVINELPDHLSILLIAFFQRFNDSSQLLRVVFPELGLWLNLRCVIVELFFLHLLQVFCLFLQELLLTQTVLILSIFSLLVGPK